MIRWEWEGTGNKKVIPAHLYRGRPDLVVRMRSRMSTSGSPRRIGDEFVGRRAASHWQPMNNYRTNGLSVVDGFPLSPSLIAHRHSVAKRGGCFQRRLFVSLSVCERVRTITSERLNIGRSNLVVRCIVQKSHPNSKVKVKGQRSKVKVTRDKNERQLSHPH